MCIDVHKLRIVAVKSVDKAAIDHAILYVNNLTNTYFTNMARIASGSPPQTVQASLSNYGATANG